MDWLGNNWIWIALVVGMIAMHLFGPRGHSHMSGHDDGADRDDPANRKTPANHNHSSVPLTDLAAAPDDRPLAPATAPVKGHRHGC